MVLGESGVPYLLENGASLVPEGVDWRDEACPVLGEVYAVSESTLELLDEYVIFQLS